MPLQAGGHTPLEAATSFLHSSTLAIVETLMEFGANPNGVVGENTDSKPLAVEAHTLNQSTKCCTAEGAGDRQPSVSSEVGPRESDLMGNLHLASSPEPVTDSGVGVDAMEQVEPETETQTQRNFGTPPSDSDSGGIPSRSVMAGEADGLLNYSPLHLACMAKTDDSKLVCPPQLSVQELFVYMCIYKPREH